MLSPSPPALGSNYGATIFQHDALPIHSHLVSTSLRPCDHSFLFCYRHYAGIMATSSDKHVPTLSHLTTGPAPSSLPVGRLQTGPITTCWALTHRAAACRQEMVLSLKFLKSLWSKPGFVQQYPLNQTYLSVNCSLHDLVRLGICIPYLEHVAK